MKSLLAIFFVCVSELCVFQLILFEERFSTNL